MKITSVTLDGFKKQNTTMPLTGRDLIVGPNGVGKSARAQAIALALLGYVPNLKGKRPQDIVRLSALDSFSVGVSTESFSCTRTFSRATKMRRGGSMDISVSQSIEVSPAQGEDTLTKAEARIKSELGDLPMVLDFGKFLDMSDGDRRSFFYGLAGIDGDEWSKDRVEEHLRSELLSETLLSNNPDAYDAQEQMLKDALAEWRNGMDADAGVKAMFEWAKARQKHWNAEKRKATGAVQKLADLKNQLHETDRGIAENRAELDRLHEEIAGVRAELARAEERRKAFEDRKSRIERLQQDLDELRQEPGTDTTALDARIAELNESIVAPSGEQEIDQIDERLATIDSRINALDEHRADQMKREAEASAQIASLKKTREAASERGGFCVISSVITCPKDFTPYIDWVDEELENLGHQLDEVKAESGRTKDAIAAAKREQVELQARRREINKAITNQRSANDAAHKEILALERQKAEAITASERRQNRIADVQGEIDRIQATPVQDVPDTDLLDKQVAGLTKQVETLKGKIAEQETARTTIANMQASMIDSTTAEYHHAAAKYLAEALGPKGLQGKMLVGALDPIRESVTDNLRTMELDREFFFETQSPTGQEVFRFGWIDDDANRVDFEALSTAQQMMLLIALVVAVLDRANPPCKILAIDDVGHLYGDNWNRVLSGLDRLSDRLDNIILAGARALAEDPEGWTVHRLGTKAEVAV